MKNRIVDLCLLGVVVAMAAVLARPVRPPPLPPAPARPTVQEVPAVLSPQPRSRPRPSMAETAALFVAATPSSFLQQKKAETSPEPAPWLHFIAYVVGTSGEATYRQAAS